MGLDINTNPAGAVFAMTAGATDFSGQYNFPATEGGTPCGSLIIGTNNKLYGMTTGGGSEGLGIIFEYDYSSDSYTKKFDMLSLTGALPGGALLKASNNKLYGLTPIGGTNNQGVIFEYDYVNNIYNKKIDLALSTGSQPLGSLIEVSNGKLYGLTPEGGANNFGVIFEYDFTSNTYTKKFDFPTTDGKPARSSLLLATNGKLYGTTSTGGTNNGGVIFEYDFVNNIYTKKIDLETSNGINPTGSLMEATNGKMYGLATNGGINNRGVLYEYDFVNNIYTKKIDLSITTGTNPVGTLMQASNGNLYGLTSNLFEYEITSNTYTPRVTLNRGTGYSATNGALFQAPDGNLYGLASRGGQPRTSFDAFGTLFSYSIPNTLFAKKLSFGIPKNGDRPKGKLILAANGKLYGTTETGGLNNQGTIFEYDQVNNIAIKKYDLYDDAPGFAGSMSNSTLIEVNGKLYGTTFSGGGPAVGTIFEYDYVNNIYTKKIDFPPASGIHPFGIVLASNGKIYGLAGGGLGKIFEYDIATNTCIFKANCPASITGACDLMQANNGKLYFLTTGGTNNGGLLVEYDYTTNTVSTKIDLATQFPLLEATIAGTPTQASDGKIYGMTTYGGEIPANGGIIYQYDPATNIFIDKFHFTSTTGLAPSGSLVQTPDGKMYGTTNLGGPANAGSVFEYDPILNTVTVKKYQTVPSEGYNISFIVVPDAGCTVTAGIINNTGTNILNCATTSVSVTATGGLTYTWDHGLGNSANAVISAPGTYTVTVAGAGGCTDTESITITQNNIAPVLSPISGLTNVCPYVGTGTQLTYSVAQDPNATGYQWIVPPTATLVSGQGTNSIVVTINNNFTTNVNRVIKVSALSACGTTAENLLYLLAQFPSTPALINASSTNVCAAITTNTAITYFIPKVTAATSYNWLAQAGTTIITHPNGPGVNDTLVTVTFTSGFTTSAITVQAVNNCGTSGTRSFTITRNNPASPGLISGPTNACEYIAPNGIAALYSVANVIGNTYTWTVPAGASSITGQGTNSISFIFPAGFTSGNVSVSTTNACGTSTVRSHKIAVQTPAIPGNIGANLIQDCPSRIYSYSIVNMPSNATSVLWAVPAGASILTGQGGTTITVSYPSTAVSGTVTAQSISNCANSNTRSYSVQLQACPVAPKLISKISQKNLSVSTTESIRIFPNPTNNDFQMQLPAIDKQIAIVSISDVQGKEIIKLNIMPGQSVRFGGELRAGIYFVEIKQGHYIKTEKLIKL